MVDSVTQHVDPTSGWGHSLQLPDIWVGDRSQRCSSPGIALTCRNQPVQAWLLPGDSSHPVTSRCESGLGTWWNSSGWDASEWPVQLQRSPWDTMLPLFPISFPPPSPNPLPLPPCLHSPIGTIPNITLQMNCCMKIQDFSVYLRRVSL